MSEKTLKERILAHPMLGKMSDRALAKELGCAQPSVSTCRRSVGIPAYSQPTLKGRILTHPMLGKRSDGALAKELGCSERLINYYRKSAGIPAYSQTTLKRRILTHPMLGKRSDGALAKELGCSQSCVRWHRNRAGISVPLGRRPVRPVPRQRLTICAPDSLISLAQSIQDGITEKDLRSSYAILHEGLEAGPVVRIGMTRDPKRRLRRHALNAPTQQRPLWLLPGGALTEAALHHRFSEYRHALPDGTLTEFFRVEGELLEMVEESLRKHEEMDA